jgi:hypothetical protein
MGDLYLGSVIQVLLQPLSGVMTDEVPECTDVIRHLLGERPCLTHQLENTRAWYIVKALNVLGLPRFPRDGFMPLCWHHPFVDLGLIHTAIHHVKRHELACGLLRRQPQPWLVCLLLHKAAQLTRFGCHSS